MIKYREVYRGHSIIIEEIDVDWSEDAYQYSIKGTSIVDECEGLDNAIDYAKEEIDNLFNPTTK